MIQEKKNITRISSETLHNGFRVILAPNHTNPVISLQLFVRIGSCWEIEEEAGYSHLMEHLVFRSTAKYPDNQLTVKASFLGSNINAYTEFDSTCFYLTLSSGFAEEGLELLSELVRNANFSASEFAFEKGVVLEELKQYQNDPEDFFLENIPELYFVKSPYKKPIIGSKASLQKATPAKLQDFYKKYYTPGNSFLVVSGDFKNNEIMDKIDHYFGDWQIAGNRISDQKLKIKTEEKACVDRLILPERLPETIYPASFTTGSRQKTVSKSMLGFAIPELSDKKQESHALGLITRIFAIGKKSRLYRRLFVKEKIVEQIRVESFTGINDGISVILIIPKSNTFIEKIIDIFLEEFDQIRHFGFTIDEFEEAKNDLLHAHRYSFEYMQYLGMSIGAEELMGDYRLFIDYPKMIRKISEESMHKIVKKYYSFQQLGIFHLGKDFLPEDKVRTKVQRMQDRKIENGAIKGDFYETRLKGGTKVILKKVTGKPTIGITAAFPVSQLNEAVSNRGINFLTSILLLYGNENKYYDQLLDFCSRHGIQIDISSHEEVTLIMVKCFSEMFATSLELLADLITTPLFPADHFHNIQRTLLSNLERIKDFPGYYAAYLWKKQILGKDSNLLEKEGTKTTLRKITRKQVVNWYKDNYLPSKMTLSIVGDFYFEDTLFNCERIFQSSSRTAPGLLNKQNVKQAVINPQKHYKKKYQPGNQQAIIHVGGFGCSAREIKKNTAFFLLAQVIGGDMNSRLNNELREKRGWAYFTGFDFISLQETGIFVASAMVDKEKSREAYRLVIRIMQEIKKNGVSEEELEIAKNTIRGQRLRAEESVIGQSSSLAMLDVLGYDYEFYLKREERLQKVTAVDLQRIAQEYFVENALYSHILE